MRTHAFNVNMSSKDNPANKKDKSIHKTLKKKH